MRVAAVGDLHVVPGSAQRLRPLYQRAAIVADLLLLAGDLTNGGDLESAAELCAVVGDLDLPVVAVLGNHDHDAGAGAQVAAMLGEAGAIVLEGTATTIQTSGGPVGVAGVKGYHAGPGAGSEAEPGAVRGPGGAPGHTTASAFRLRDALASLDTDVRIALTHYAPVMDTLAGEAPEIHRYLGSSLLGEAIDGTLPPAAGQSAESPQAELVGAGRLAGTATGGTTAGGTTAWRSAASLPAPTSRPATPGGDAPGAEGTPRTALAVHGHAHHGQEMGRTLGGTPVRNVARPVIVAPFAVYQLPGGARVG